MTGDHDKDYELAAKQGFVWAVHLYEEEVFDSEEDIVGVAVSFLVVQALRQYLSGHLPNNFGVEEEKEDYMHTPGEAYSLLACGFLSLVLLKMLLVAKESMKHSFHGNGGRLLKRIFGSFQKAFAMIFSWCILYFCMYREARVLEVEAPWTITCRMILAFVLSVVAFTAIFFIDAIQSMAESEQAQEYFYEIIMALSILVGFSWEQCFDRAVEVVAMVGHQRFHIQEENTEIFVACLICAIVFFPWRRVILQIAITYEEDCVPEEEESESEGSSESEESSKSGKSGKSGDPAKSPRGKEKADEGPKSPRGKGEGK